MIDPITNKYNIKNSKEIDRLLKRRNQIVRKFNRVSIPILGVYYLYLALIHQKYSTNFLIN